MNKDVKNILQRKEQDITSEKELNEIEKLSKWNCLMKWN